MRERVIGAAELLVALLGWMFFLLVVAFLLKGDVYVAADTSERVRAHIRTVEFDFVDWTLLAIGRKLSQSSIDTHALLDESARAQLVLDYFSVRRELETVQGQIAAGFADPNIADPEAATTELRAQRAALEARAARMQPLAEAILQEQLSVILAEQGLAVAGQPIPPVSFHLTPLPYALIVSPRDVIRQDANLDVSGDLTLEERVALEERIAEELNVSTLTVPLGGIGTYPTMIGQSSDLPWVASVVAHEWIHNYLTLRPLGIRYFVSPALRTMNETTAEIMGNELGALLLERFYPELAPPAQPFRNFLRRDQPPAEQRAPVFDFRAEMRETRVRVEALLAAGEIEAAEEYMEERRRFFWEHGYQIRKLNQAYFAFYGAYAAGGGGAAGVDPVGAAVRLLFRRSPDLAYFVNTMASFTSFDELQRFLGLPPVTTG